MLQTLKKRVNSNLFECNSKVVSTFPKQNITFFERIWSELTLLHICTFIPNKILSNNVLNYWHRGNSSYFICIFSHVSVALPIFQWFLVVCSLGELVNSFRKLRHPWLKNYRPKFNTGVCKHCRKKRR